MKRLFLIGALTALTCLSCKEKEPDSFKVSASGTDFSSQGGSLSVLVSTNVEYNVTVKEGADWIIPVKTKAVTDYSLVFEIKANTDVEERKGSILFTSSAGEQTIQVTQKGIDAVLSVTWKEEIIPAQGGSFTVDVTSNGEVQVDISCSWIHRDETKAETTKQLTFLVDENSESNMRTGAILFTWKSKVYSLSVSQAMPTQYDLVPGFYGLAGLNWTFEPQKMQILVRESGSSSEMIFVLFEPASNRLIQMRYWIEDELAAGSSVVATLIQNVDSSHLSVQSAVKCTVKSLSGPFIVLQDAEGHEAVIKK